MKQYFWKPITVGCLDIPNVVKLVEHQHIDYFLQLNQDYNEDLIRVFYSGLHDMQCSIFKFSIGNKVYQFINDLWKSLFGIMVVDPDDDNEVDPLITDTETHVNFDWGIHVNELLKVSRVEDCYDPITTGQLKMVPRVLQWVVSHILRPKNGELSRIDFVEIHLVYILLHKVKIN